VVGRGWSDEGTGVGGRHGQSGEEVGESGRVRERARVSCLGTGGGVG
jgi:hypothetical protein